MTKQDFVDAVADAAGMSKREAGAAVDAMLLSSLLSRGIRLHDKIRRGPTRGDSWVPCFDALPGCPAQQDCRHENQLTTIG